MQKKFSFIYAFLAIMVTVILVQSYYLYKLGQDIQESAKSTPSTLALKSEKAIGGLGADPFAQIKIMQEEMLKSFSNFNSMFANDPFFQNAFKDMQVLPMSDIIQTNESYIVKLNIPGAKKQKLNISAEGNTLHVQAEVEKTENKNEENYMQKERYWQKFERKFTLPDDADLEEMTSDYKDGVLKIVIPKKK